MAASYLAEPFGKKGLQRVSARIAAKLRQAGVKFDAIACRGVSGMAIGPVVAYRMRKRLMVVRKERGGHSVNAAEMALPPMEQLRYVVVDDLIGSGDTAWAIMDTIARESRYTTDYQPKCVGIVLYNPTAGQVPPLFLGSAMVPVLLAMPDELADVYGDRRPKVRDGWRVAGCPNVQHIIPASRPEWMKKMERGTRSVYTDTKMPEGVAA